MPLFHGHYIGFAGSFKNLSLGKIIAWDSFFQKNAKVGRNTFSRRSPDKWLRIIIVKLFM
jgi:hypothetical protein